ncbi:MAG: hypothetical protein ABW079_17595 [Sedimenticola sp.]
MGDAAEKRDDEIIELGMPECDIPPLTERVDAMTVRVKKIATTDDGKLSITLESEGMSDDALANVKDMLVLQQNGAVLLSMEPVQRSLFDG